MSKVLKSICALILVTLPAAASPGAPPATPGGLELRQRLAEPAAVPAGAMEAVVVFGRAGGRLLVGAEPRAVAAGGDEWGGMNLWSVLPDGGDAVRLTEGQNVLRAVFEPRSRRILVWTREMELLLLDERGQSATRLAADAGTPAFSPDGRRIAYAALPAGWRPGTAPGVVELRVLERATGASRTLTAGYADAEPIWTPDGRTVLFLSGRTGLLSLWKVAADGRALRQVTNAGVRATDPDFVPSPAAGTDVRWSPDGRSLLYVAPFSEEAQEGGQVMVVRFGRGYEPVAALDLGPGREAVWTRRGTVLVTPRAEVGAETEAAERSFEDARRRIDLAAPRAAAEASTIGPGGPVPSFEPDVAGGPPRFRWPFNGYPNPVISYFYDNDSGPGILDWTCGPRTYNGHQGTDIPANCGNTVVAGASGAVSLRFDGCPTVGYIGSPCGWGFGNHVWLDHGQGWTTIYAHMWLGSPTWAAQVACGDYVGISATSGNSSGCHLHFEVMHYGYPFDDPFSSICAGPEMFWCDQNGGVPVMLCCEAAPAPPPPPGEI